MKFEFSGPFSRWELFVHGAVLTLELTLISMVLGLLKAGHDGCLPLVFDDAFTNADPLRLALLQQMLALAVARGLQVIVLTCDPQSYSGLDGTTVNLAPLAP